MILRRNSLSIVLACLFMFIILLTFTMKANAIDVPAKAFVLIDANSGRILESNNPDTPLPPASTTKIVTALLALENLELDDELIVPNDFVNDGEAGIWLEPGEKHTVEGMLMAMMLRSANDAAQMLAIGVSGSVEKFADLMNEKVEALGLKNTHFVNPNGLHNDDHYTSAYDLAILTREALKIPDFNRIITTNRYQLPWVQGEYDRVVYNRNTLLDKYPLADGVKNGYTKEAGSCLVSSATKDGHRLIAVVLNCSDMYNVSQNLLEYGFANYQLESLCEAGEMKGTVNVIGGKAATVEVVTRESAKTAISTNKDVVFGEKLNLPASIEAPVDKGQILGSITYTDNDGYSISVDLVATNDVDIYGFWMIFKKIWRGIWYSWVYPSAGNSIVSN